MNKIRQGVFLDFGYKSVNPHDNLNQGRKFFSEVCYNISDIFDSRKKSVFKIGYDCETNNPENGSFRRIFQFHQVFPASHSFQIYQAKDRLEKLVDGNESVNCYLFSAQYKVVNEANARVLKKKKDHLIVAELLGLIPGSQNLKLGSIHDMFNIYKF